MQAAISPTLLAKKLGVTRQRVHQILHPEKHRARRLLRSQVQAGKIVTPKQCERCREAKRLHAHHDDYSKPYEVVWVCAKCHAVIHPHHMTVNETPQDKARRTAARKAKQFAKVCDAPFIKALQAKCETLELTMAPLSRLSVVIQGKHCNVSRLSRRTTNEYLSMRRPHRPLDFTIYFYEPANLWLVVPQGSLPKTQTLFSVTKPSLRKTLDAYTLRHDFRDYIDAWHLLRS